MPALMPRNIDGILQHDVSTQAQSRERSSRKKRTVSKKMLIVCLSVFLGVVVIGWTAWYLFLNTPANKDPFTPQVAASVQFPLYYPKRLPSGFRIDGGSVTQPQTGVVLFNLKGPGNQKVYFSEEARPKSYDIGGFFKKFSGLKEYAITGGTVAVGKIDGGQSIIGSMINNKVWIIANTNDQRVTPEVMSVVFRSLVANGVR